MTTHVPSSNVIHDELRTSAFDSSASQRDPIHGKMLGLRKSDPIVEGPSNDMAPPELPTGTEGFGGVGNGKYALPLGGEFDGDVVGRKDFAPVDLDVPGAE